MRNGTNPPVFYTMVEATMLWSNIQRYSKSAAIGAQKKFRNEQQKDSTPISAEVLSGSQNFFEPKFALVLIKINSTKKLFSLSRSLNRLTSPTNSRFPVTRRKIGVFANQGRKH